jgi:hypothetical protein
VRKQRRVSKASSENAKLTIVTETRAKAKKNLLRIGAERNNARMVAVEM